MDVDETFQGRTHPRGLGGVPATGRAAFAQCTRRLTELPGGGR
ncbi:MAG TPA: hypothetical protein VGC67_05595 [Cellulomonas sp.]